MFLILRLVAGRSKPVLSFVERSRQVSASVLAKNRCLTVGHFREERNTKRIMSVGKIANNQLKNAVTGELTTFGSLWQEKPCVIIFFRRWGCIFCRLWATEISQISEKLSENNVRLIGVGVEDLGVEEFIQGKFFKGELFVDVEKKAYKDLGYKRFSWITILASLVSGEARAAISKGRAEKLGGDTRGDALQVGGALVVSAGGKEVLLDFKQERPAEHLPNSKFLEVLGLAPTQGDGQNKPQVFDAECKIPGK